LPTAGPQNDAELERHEDDHDRHQKGGDRWKPRCVDHRSDRNEEDRNEGAWDQEQPEQRWQSQLLSPELRS
jgi:hypothetical protein